MKTRMMLLVLLVFGLVACQANAEVIFSDNFDSYADGTVLGDTAAWTTEIDAATAGSMTVVGGQVKSQNNYYGSLVLYKAYVDGINQADYTVKVDGMKFPGYGGFYYAMGRVSGDDYVYAEAIPSGTDLYFRVGDTQGNKFGDYYFAAFDETMPVNIELDMQGSTVTATATHGSASHTLTFETAVTGSGAPGFGVQGNQWIPYTVANFDNFEVSAVVPEPMTLVMLGMGGLGLLRRKNG